MYHRLGKIPHKRHTIFKKEDGGLYYEQLFGKEGFSGDASLLYHLHPPTQVSHVGELINTRPEAAVQHNITSRKLKGDKLIKSGDFIAARTVLFFNDDLLMGLLHPSQGHHKTFYKNASGDELLFIHHGKGTLHSMLGKLKFVSGDYLYIPQGLIYQLEFDNANNKILYIESSSNIGFPKRYLSKKGQFLEHAPVCERDIRLPEFVEPVDQSGEFVIQIKKQGMIHAVTYVNHPFDVVGWDGYSYPFAISIHDFEPITGRIHMPPPVHQLFEGHNFVICSFCPRLYDYHPEAIPAPYNHSNLDSDEVLYYVEGNFMSRDNIECGDFTLHPAGIPHGPHPGTIEKSIGKEGTEELAVMIDPFKPLKLTKEALQIEDPLYYKSWLTKK